MISSFLSADFFQPLSSLSFLVYLLHPLPIIIHVAMTKEIQQLDHFYMVNCASVIIPMLYVCLRSLAFGSFYPAQRKAPCVIFQAMFFLGVLLMTHFGAYIAHIAVELPFAGLERLFKSPPRPMDDLGKIRKRPERPQPVLSVTPPEGNVNFDSGIITRYKF